MRRDRPGPPGTTRGFQDCLNSVHLLSLDPPPSRKRNVTPAALVTALVTGISVPSCPSGAPIPAARIRPVRRMSAPPARSTRPSPHSSRAPPWLGPSWTQASDAARQLVPAQRHSCGLRPSESELRLHRLRRRRPKLLRRLSAGLRRGRCGRSVGLRRSRPTPPPRAPLAHCTSVNAETALRQYLRRSAGCGPCG
jgi:hypothetical protein